MLSRPSLISRFEPAAIHSAKSSLQTLRAVSAISQSTLCTCMGLPGVFMQVTSLHRHNDPLGEGERYMHFNSENKHTHTLWRIQMTGQFSAEVCLRVQPNVHHTFTGPSQEIRKRTLLISN